MTSIQMTGFCTEQGTIHRGKTEPEEGEKTWHSFIGQAISTQKIKGFKDFRRREREPPEDGLADQVQSRQT